MQTRFLTGLILNTLTSEIHGHRKEPYLSLNVSKLALTHFSAKGKNLNLANSKQQ
jgi:hypothetical protein